jgi:hypothetical protein
MLALAAVALVYAGGLAALVGPAWLAWALLGFARPAPLVRVEGGRSRLDAVMPLQAVKRRAEAR